MTDKPSYCDHAKSVSKLPMPEEGDAFDDDPIPAQRRMIMSNVQEHSREAYDKIEVTRESYGEAIYKFIRENPGCSDLDISKGTLININAVSAPRAQLVQDNRIHSESTKVNEETGMTVKAWRVGPLKGSEEFDLKKPVELEMCPFCMKKATSQCTWCKGKGYVKKQ